MVNVQLYCNDCETMHDADSLLWQRTGNADPYDGKFGECPCGNYELTPVIR